MAYKDRVPPSDELDDDVQRMLGGDEDAFRVVYRSVQPRLQRYLSALVGPTDAEDVAAETWAQAFRDLGRFSGGADGFRGWITTIARHRALDHLRALGRRPLADLPEDALAEKPAPHDVQADVGDIVSTQEALGLIRSLPPEQAEAVLLRAVMGLDAKSAGAILGRSAGAVRTAAYRGLRALAERLSAAAGEPADEPASDTASDISEPPDAEELR